MRPEDLRTTVERMMAGDEHSRRAFLRAVAAVGATAGGGSLLAACGGVAPAGTQTAPARSARHPQEPLDRLNVSNWPLYIDKKVVPAFERRFDVAVRYTEDINDNAEFFGKVRAQLQRGQDIDRDLVVQTDWMAARWIRSGYAEPLDKANIPNARNLLPALRAPEFDKTRAFTLPWQSGITTLVYNRARTGEVRSLEQVFDPRFKGRVSMLSEARDTIGLTLLAMGVAPERASLEQIRDAIARVDEANRSGQVRRFTGIDYLSDLASGSVWIGFGYAQDMRQLAKDNPDLRYAIADEGALIYTDNAMIPRHAQHPYAAEVFLNYVYEPEVAAKIAAAVRYTTPVRGVREILERTNPTAARDELVFPDEALLARLHPYWTLSPEDDRAVAAEFAAVTGA